MTNADKIKIAQYAQDKLYQVWALAEFNDLPFADDLKTFIDRVEIDINKMTGPIVIKATREQLLSGQTFSEVIRCVS